MKAQMEDLRVRSTQEVGAVLALKDEGAKKLEQVRAQLLLKIQDLENDRDRLSKEYAEEKEKAEQYVHTIQAELDAVKEAREREATSLKAQMEDLRVRNSQEVQAALALKDEEAKKLEQVRAQLLLKIQDLDRVSKERAEEMALADALLRKTRQDLDGERAAREVKDGDIARLAEEVERSRAQSAREREEGLALTEEVGRELEQVREQLEESLSDRARLSREYAEEQTKAEERARKIRDDLDAERSAAEGRLRQIAKLESEKEEANLQLERLKGPQRRGSLFSLFADRR